MRILRRLVPTPSMVVALLALVLVSAGSAVAGSLVTSAQIKDHTIKVVDLKKSTVKALKGKKGATGAAGEQGPQGPEGAQGPEGDAGLARGYAMIQPNGTLYNQQGTFANLTIVHPATGVYCLGNNGNSTGIGNYGPVIASAHGQDFTKYVATVNLEYGSQCNPHGGHGVFLTKLDGTPVDGYVMIALL